MVRMQVSIELRERELHILTYLPEINRGRIINLNQVKFESVLIPEGWLEQGQIQGHVLTKILSELRLKLNIPAHTLTRLALPLANGFIRQYNLPWIGTKYRNSAIQYLAGEETSIPQNNQVLSYRVIEEQRELNQMTVVLGVTRRSVLESLLPCFKSAGFEVIAVEFTPAVLASFLGPSRYERYLCLNESDTGIQMLLFHGAVPEMTRYFPLNPAGDFEEWLGEMVRSLGFMNETSTDRICRIIISGHSTVTRWAQGLQKAGLPWIHPEVEVIPIEQWVEQGPWRKSLPQNVFSFLPCVGLALQRNARKMKPEGQGVNLLDEYIRKEQAKHQEIIASLVLALIFMSGFGLWFQGKDQQAALSHEVTELQATAEKLQQLDQKQKQLAGAWNGIKSAKTGIADPLKSVQKINSQGLHFGQLEYKEGRLTLQGSVEQPEDLEKLLEELQAQNWGQVRLSQYHQEKSSGYDFTVTAVRKVDR